MKRTRKGVVDKYLNVPAQENSTALNIMRLALANRTRRGKDEQMPDGAGIIIFFTFPLFSTLYMGSR